MSFRKSLHRECTRGALLLAVFSLAVETALAQDVQDPCTQAQPGRGCPGVCGGVSSTLGTFEPTPYIIVRGNWPTGGGYSPMDLYGDQTMTLYGPLSPLRATSAPVTTYSRGYDGRPQVRKGTSFSTPNLPVLSPVVYPNQGSYFYGPRVNRTPPWWSSGANWIDQQ